MSLRNIAALYLVRLRGRAGQELLAFVGIAVGVSLLFAALVANSSLTGSYERLVNGIVGDARYQLIARGSATLDASLLGAVQRFPGVARAGAILEAHGEAQGPDGGRSVLLLGVTPDVGGLNGSFTHGFSYDFLANVQALAMPTPLARSLRLALGQPVQLTLGDRVVTARLGAKLQASDIGICVESPIVIAPLRYAQRLTGQTGRATRIVVEPQPGRDATVAHELKQLATALHADVRPANFDATLFREASIPTSQSTAMFSAFGAIVGFLFAFSAMLLTVPQRRRLIADLSMEGYGTITVVQFLLFDALVLGITASTAGVIVGDQIARRLFDAIPNFLTYAFAAVPGRIVTAPEIAVAVGGGIVASCVAVLAPTAPGLWRQGRPPAPRARRRRRRAPINRSAWGGVLCLAVGVAAIGSDSPSTEVGVGGLAALTISLLLLLPLLLRAVVAALDRGTQRLRSVVPFVAVVDLRDRSARARSLAVATTGAVAVFASVALQGAHADLLRGLDRTSRDIASLGQVWALAPGDANLFVTAPFRAPALRPHSEIRRVDVFRGGFLDIGDRRVRVFGLPSSVAQPLSRVQFLEGDPHLAIDRVRAGGWFIVSKALAREHGLHVGDRFMLPTAVPTPLRVAALSTNLGWPPGSIVMSADDYARAAGNDAVSALLVTLAPGTTAADGRRAAQAALPPESGLVVRTAGAFEHAQETSSRDGLARLGQIAALVLISAVVAMASAMAGLLWQRRAFIADVKLEGYSTAELWWALLVEAALLIGAGCVIGAAFGLLGQGLLSHALTSVTGFPVIYAPAAAEALTICIAVAGAAVAIVAVFGRRIASLAP